MYSVHSLHWMYTTCGDLFTPLYIWHCMWSWHKIPFVRSLMMIVKRISLSKIISCVWSKQWGQATEELYHCSKLNISLPFLPCFNFFISIILEDACGEDRGWEEQWGRSAQGADGSQSSSEERAPLVSSIKYLEIVMRAYLRCGEIWNLSTTVMWRYFRFLHMTDVENSELPTCENNFSRTFFVLRNFQNKIVYVGKKWQIWGKCALNGTVN